ncbi:MAG: deoxyribodipyrimidine photo-lyase [Anaerolineae bacterium]|nr:deoxyribodipyrimidine photo-lyase [Anaerolineae bacterium]
MSAPVIHWFRRDLRLRDNTALNAALASGAPIIPVFILDENIIRSKRSSPARMQFLLDGLHQLDADLKGYGSRLLVLRGTPREALLRLKGETGAAALHYNRDYSPYARKRDAAVERAFGGPTHTHDDLLLHPPGSVLSQADAPYTVFTPFKRAWLTLPKPNLQGDGLAAGRFHNLDGLDTPPIPSLADLGLRAEVTPPDAGEAAALARLERFMARAIYAYGEARDLLYADPWSEAAHGTSTLSPYLRFGMISPRQVYQAAVEAQHRAVPQAGRESVDTWINELCWREFYTHILHHFPHVARGSFRRNYDDLEWRDALDEFAAWQTGQTGYPVVDAAMRQLAQTGWMHNRARMIVASFLTKDLLIDWRAGEQHFMQHLIDGDPAANNGGWQWSAGTGTDAQPYFRIFNPVSQSRKFDPDARYIRHFVPELRDVADAHLHAPWEMDSPPRNYPPPLVDHKQARARALAAFKRVG